MYIETVAMNQLVNNGGRLFRTIRIPLDPVPPRERFGGNCQESCPVPDAWIQSPKPANSNRAGRP